MAAKPSTPMQTDSDLVLIADQAHMAKRTAYVPSGQPVAGRLAATLLLLLLTIHVDAQSISIINQPQNAQGMYLPLEAGNVADSCQPVGRFVELQTGDVRARFDRCFGGVPRFWYLYNNVPTTPTTQANVNEWRKKSIISPHPGEAMSVVYELGQSPTQASPNGVDPFPVHRVDGQDVIYNYYIRETALTYPSPSSPAAVYEVTGFAPFFLISSEPRHDAIVAHNPTSPHGGWMTQCSTCPHPPSPTCANAFVQPGVPIWFVGSAEEPSGLMFIADYTKTPGAITCPGTVGPVLWNQRLLEIDEGRVACKIRIAMPPTDAPPGTLAGIMFRRQIPATSPVSIHDAFAAPGYLLSVDTNGNLSLIRADGLGNAAIVWPPSGGTPSNPLVLGVVTPTGVQLEVRTHNAIPGRLEILVDDIPVGVFDDPAPILGQHFGLYAQSPFDSVAQQYLPTRVRFSERQVFDVGVEFVARYSALSGGIIESDIIVRNAPGVTSEHHFHPHHVPGVFFNAAGIDLDGDGVTSPLLNLAEVFDACGNLAACSEDGSECGPSVCPFLQIGGACDAFCCGIDNDQDGHHNWCDNCPIIANPTQSDADDDGTGDACEGLPPAPPTPSCPENPIVYPDSCVHTALSRVLSNVGVSAYSHFIGDLAHSIGLYMTPRRAEVNGETSSMACSTVTNSQLVLDANGQEGRFVVSTVCPFGCEIDAREFRMVTWWSTKLPVSDDPPPPCVCTASCQCEDFADVILDVETQSIVAALLSVPVGGTLGLLGMSTDETLTIDQHVNLVACDGPVTIGEE